MKNPLVINRLERTGKVITSDALKIEKRTGLPQKFKVLKLKHESFEDIRMK